MTARPIVVLMLLVAGAWAPAAALTLLANENPPFNFTEKGTLTGASTEIIQEMASRAGVPVKTEIVPWDKAYVRTQGTRDTCLFSTARPENRERLFLWVGPIAMNYWAVYGKGDFAPTIRTLKDLAPYRIGSLVRDAKTDFLRENAVTDLRPVREDVLNPPRLLLPRDNPERIDLWITGIYEGRSVASAAKVTDVKLVFIAAEEPLFLACNPQTDRKIVQSLADALDGMKADGSFKRITAEYERRFPR